MKKDNEVLWCKTLPDSIELLPGAKFLSKAEADRLLNDTPKRTRKTKRTTTKGKKK